MSAFIVSNRHLNAIVTYLIDGIDYIYHGGVRLSLTTQTIGQTLLDQNYRSVNHRYNESTETPEYKHHILRDISPIQIIKACRCLRYQCCETDDYYDSLAHTLLERTIDKAIHNLPGYEEARWELDDYTHTIEVI